MTKNKNIPYIKYIPIIIIGLLLFKFIDNIDSVFSLIKSFFSIITPFIWALGIAYLLNPLMKYFETKLRLKRWFSLLITYVLVIGFITIFLNTLLPKIIKNIGDLLNNAPNYIDETMDWFNNTVKHTKIYDTLIGASKSNDTVSNLLDKVSSFTNVFINGFVNKTIKFTSSMLKFLFGLIISIYLLLDKESLINNIKKALKALTSKDTYNNLISFFKEVDLVFSNYIVGKFIDSLIIGLICLVGLNIMNIPYAALIAFIVGVTNMIPYFGPFIGMIPAVIITIFYSYIKAIWVLIFIIILQQFDGLFLGPKILGNQVGLGPIWIILAITIGGGTFGILGMFLAVPIGAIVKIYLDKYINKKLNKKYGSTNVKND
ncbi:AI-2E family transporter [Clostridium oceanicum]|uniref:AI-2E family transporter n=1 Tax=Clostridium oceanicum TaxID=1543 RepID=UPI0031DCCE24